jgi:hypothetical protein
MSKESDFRLNLWQCVVRLGPLLLLGGLAFGEAARGARGERPYEVGSKAIVYDSRAAKILLKEARMRVLSPALENGGGLLAIYCADRDRDPDGLRCLPLHHFGEGSGSRTKRRPATDQCDTQIMVADAWEGLATFCVERTTEQKPQRYFAAKLSKYAAAITGGPEAVGQLRAASLAALRPSTRQTCPDSECLDVEHGGVAVDDVGDITLTEPHTERITTFRVGLRPPAAIREPDAEAIGKVQYSGRAGRKLHDVSTVPGVGLVIAESSSANPTASSVRLLVNGEAPGVELVSGLYAPRPVGVWFSRDTKRLYVTDVSHGVQRWMYVEQAADGSWSTPRTFWTTADSGSKPPLLRHLITGWNSAAGSEESPEIVFAAGPDGLYVIDPAGLLLGKYALGRPLSGLDWGKPGELFFSSGRFLGVLRVADAIHARNVDGPTPSPPATVQPPTDTRVPVTTPSSTKPLPLGSPVGDKSRPKKPTPNRPATPTCICR